MKINFLNKDKLILTILTVLFLILILITINSQSQNIPFETIDKGYYSQLYEDKNYIIDNEDDWESFWNKTKGEIAPIPSKPNIDFTKEMVLASSIVASTGGYLLNITRIVETRSVTVEIHQTSPGEMCVVTQSISSAYQIVKIKKTNKPIKFEKTYFVNNCQ